MVADPDPLIELLDNFIDECNRWFTARASRSWDDADNYLERMIEWLPLVEQIAARVAPGGLAHIQGRVLQDDEDWSLARSLALSCRGLIERGQVITEALGPAADVPALMAETLHPTVWDAARSYWRSEHYRAGVEAAANA